MVGKNLVNIGFFVSKYLQNFLEYCIIISKLGDMVDQSIPQETAHRQQAVKVNIVVERRRTL